MSLRLRLVIFIGLALSLLWGASATWMWRNVTHDLQRMLDDRLAMSAHMVAGLVNRRQIGTGADPGRAADALVTVPAGQGMACQIRSMRGEVIAATQGASTVLSGDVTPGYHTRVINDTAWRTFTLQTNNLSITTADRVGGREKLRHGIALTASIPFLIAAVGGLLALWLGATRALWPVRRLRNAVSRRGPDALDPLDTAAQPRELRPLVATLNRLLQRTHQAMQRERHFTNDAAHELRTPLTAISTHLQVARLTSGADAQAALADAEAGVVRLRTTLEQLLLLARVEGRLPFDENAAVTADKVLARAVADSGAETESRLVCHVNEGETSVAAASSLAVVALRNLIENALRHTPADTPVHIHVGVSGASVVFRVIDQGPGLDDQATTQAVRRFWRTGAQHGSGLGLTIVDAIAQRYGGQLLLTNREPGLEARLELPRVQGR